jgi:hypothetical protein
MQFSLESLNINKGRKISVILNASAITRGGFTSLGFQYVLEVTYFASIGGPCIIGSLNITTSISESQIFTREVIYSSLKFDPTTTRVKCDDNSFEL